MFLSPKDLTPRLQKLRTNREQPVLLRAEHLVLHAELAGLIFDKERTVYMVYYPARGVLMLAPRFNEVFKQLHKAKQYILKEVAGGNEYAVALHGILLDHNVQSDERFLSFEAEEAINMLTVHLS